MISPSPLKAGDKVAVIASAKQVQPEQIHGAIEHIRSWGLELVEGENLYERSGYFAGSDASRVRDLQTALDDPSIRAILFARGGYGTVRIIDQIDWKTFKSDPKWLCGFSDLTVLHNHVQRNVGVQSLHASMPIFFGDGVSNVGSESLRSALFGEDPSLDWKGHGLNRQGEASGNIVGGNLSVLYSMSGSKSEPNYRGNILLIEDLCEHLYHLDRMMQQFKRAGHFDQLAGMIVGQFTDMEENDTAFGKSAYEIIHEAVDPFDFPVAFDAPVGHVTENYAVVLGRKAKLNGDAHRSVLKYSD